MTIRAPRCIVIGGSLAQRPHFGGHTWVFLQYLLGFRALGSEVLFVDRLDPDMAVDRRGNRCRPEQSVNWKYLSAVMKTFGLQGSYALSCEGGRRWLGLTRPEVIERVRRSAMLINVMGFIEDPDVLAAARRRIFLDIDPGFGQMWKQLGLADPFSGHDQFVTVGENIGRDDCAIPNAGIDWITTRPPVVLDQWPRTEPTGLSFTSIGSWRGPYAPIQFEGNSFGLRVHEFRKFFGLPARTRERFRMALDIDTAETSDLQQLEKNDWELENPRIAAGDPWLYRRYIQSAKAEFMVAKGMYVTSRSGWTSDRSVCFLASGKPVLAQDTAVGDNYPTGEGLLVFCNEDEAALGVHRISREYPRHAKKARELAETYFGSEVVLGELLDKLGA